MTNAIYDYAFVKALREVPWTEWMENEDRPFGCRLEYLEKFDEWIHSTELNTVRGLERFSERHLINGTTQTFDEAYFTYKERRLRIFRGEYAYHSRIVRTVFLDTPLEKNDWVIISLPFCTTGDKHDMMDEILDQALLLDVPVIVDCAYFGTCHSVEFDFNHPAITSVSFSLTKGLGLGDIRSGIRYSNIVDDNPICQQNRYDHTILGAAKIGIHMMERFSPDFIPAKYREAQESACADIGLTPTKCMHLALGNFNEHPDYQIDGKYARFGIRNLVKKRFRRI